MTSKAEDKPSYPWPLIIAATVLSTASLVWTASSIYDLLTPSGSSGLNPSGLAVALGSDIVWAGVLIAQWKQYKLGWEYKKKIGKDEDGKNLYENRFINFTHAIGWTFLAAVVTLLVWHGIAISNPAAAFGGSLIPIGAKIMWMFAISASRNPAELTAEQQDMIHGIMRESDYEARVAEAQRKMRESKHNARMMEIRMQGDLKLAQEDVEFNIRLNRMEKAQELFDKSPLMVQMMSPGQNWMGELTSPVTPKGLGPGGNGGTPSSETIEVDETDGFPTESPSGPVSASESSGTGVITMSVDTSGLTPVQKKNKLIAAEFYLLKSRGQAPTQKRFALSKGISPGQFSKILNEYKIETINQEDLDAVEPDLREAV